MYDEYHDRHNGPGNGPDDGPEEAPDGAAEAAGGAGVFGEDLFGPDDLVTGGVRQWRRQPVPDGPSPDAIARTLAAVRAAAAASGGVSDGASYGPRANGQALRAAPPAGHPASDAPSGTSSGSRTLRTLRERIGAMNRWTRLAAAAVIALAFAGSVLLLAPGKAVAFADVKKQIQEAQSMSYTMHMDMGPQPITVKVTFRLPGQMREETADHNMVAVFDVQKQKAVTVLHKEKMVVVLDLGDLTDLFKQKLDSAQPFKELLDGQKEDLGRREVDGKTLQGYRLKQSGQTMNLWVDPKTGQPVRFDLPDFKATITDIAINPKLDDSLFALDIPAGYKVEEQKMDLGNVTEKDFVEGIEMLAKFNGGTFLDQPTFTPAMMETLKKGQVPGSQGSQAAQGQKPTTQQSKEEGLRFSKAFSRMLLFMAQTTQAGGKFDYFGGGVAVGDKSRPVAWWRAKDAKTYRVLYGDLHLDDADPAHLPTTQPATK